MGNELSLNGWQISGISEEWADDFQESIFFLGNGRMGVRGYLPVEPEKRPVQKGLYLAGIFGEIKPGITDFVNLPTPVWDQVCLNGTAAQLVSPIRRTLDLRRAMLTASFCVAAEGVTVSVAYQRFFPMEHPALMLQRMELTPDKDCRIEIKGGIQKDCCNSPIPDDQTKDNAQTIQLSFPEDSSVNGQSIHSRFAIRGTNLTVSESVTYHSDDFTISAQPEEIAAMAKGKAGIRMKLDKLACVLTSRDLDSRIASAPNAWSFDSILESHCEAWVHRWERCDFVPNGIQEDLLTGLRYAMFQLWGSCSGRDPSVSIGARGLSHGRYKGCYFWDTDLFMLPFFLENDLEAAKNLCEYRVRSLDAAKRHSASMNTAGARYPWMAALDGTEQCETWDIGCSELHITADVAYALKQYVAHSGDESFYLDKAAEVFVETARFWVSRYSFRPESGRADLLFCKGPDEYCGITNNNLFTNVMVQQNLKFAIQAAKDLQKKRPQTYARLGITEAELEAMGALCTAIPWPRDPETGRLRQDDSFHLLEPVDITQIKLDAGASYHHVCFDRLQRYRVIKQADVLLLMTRLPELFTDREKRQAWEDFEPLCLHDSTLSFASHALFALQNGIGKPGMEYLRKALLLDLQDIMGNTGKEGLHLACMGEAWQAARALFSDGQTIAV